MLLALATCAILSFRLAADYEQSGTVRVAAALALPSATRCVFDGGIETAGPMRRCLQLGDAWALGEQTSALGLLGGLEGGDLGGTCLR